MREDTDRERIEKFMSAFGRAAKVEGCVYFTGGACAVLLGWRSKTMDIDLKLAPDQDVLIDAISDLKNRLDMNIEFACPSDFIPELPDWEARSSFIAHHGKLTFRHYDFYSQALSKIERGHAQDLSDVRNMIKDGLIEKDAVLQYFEKIAPRLKRYPAIEPEEFRKRVEDFLKH